MRKFDFDCSAKFITFNYTETLERLYSVPADKILHIHGKAHSDSKIISYGFARFCRDECSYFTEGQEFVPCLTFKEQTGDKTIENIRKCTENAVNKRKEEKIP